MSIVNRLKWSQLSRCCKIFDGKETEVKYVYVENGSKNNAGGVAHLKVTNEV